MDFLKAFKEAQTMGLTKEEFIGVWKTESDLKLVLQRKEHNLFEDVHEGRQLSQRGPFTPERSLNSFSKEPRTEKENENDISTILQLMRKQLFENQELYWQQLQSSFEDMRGEVRSRFEILTNHTSNIANYNTDTLKLHFMQELDLLKQELVKIVKEHAIQDGASCMLKMSQKQAAGVQQTVPASTLAAQQTVRASTLEVQQTIPTFIESSTATVSNTVNDEEGTERSQKRQQKLTTFSHQQQTVETCQLPKEVKQIRTPPESEATLIITSHESEATQVKALLENEQEEAVLDKNYVPESLQNGKGKSLAHVVAIDKESNEAIKEFSSFKSDHVITCSSYKESEKMLETSSIKDYIEDVRKVNHKTPSVTSSPAPSECSGCLSESVKYDDPILLLSHGDQEFTFAVTGGVGTVRSSPMYSSGKLCKARLQVGFETTGHIVFRVLVTGGVFDADHQWPLLLSGTGFILHNGSKQYTPIWELLSVSCQNPRANDSDQVFQCAVCLSTTRRKFSNVQFKQLVQSQFVNCGFITLKWTLNAIEK